VLAIGQITVDNYKSAHRTASNRSGPPSPVLAIGQITVDNYKSAHDYFRPAYEIDS
jgi:hypothetical protein